MRRGRMTVPVVERSAFAGFRFPPHVITLAVRWYLRYGLSYRDLEELPAERGIEVDHVTVYRWVQRSTPLFADAARPCRHATGDRWFVDETHVKGAGRWRYLHRAVDQFGQVIDVLVSEQRDTAAPRRFFTRASTHGPAPVEVSTDKAAAYLRVLDELVPDAQHLTERYANNPIEALQHEVAHRERAERIGGPSHRQSSSGLVLTACPHSGVRRRCCRLWGTKPGGEAQGLSFRPGVTGKGKTGRVNVSESSLTPRYPEPSWTGRRRRCRACRWETAVAAGWGFASRASTTAPGDRGHPTRSYLRCVERGNTVVVHPGTGGGQDRLTPRRNMTRKKRTAAAERRQERARKTAPSSGRAYNWPHTRPGVWGRKTADVRGWAFDEL